MKSKGFTLIELLVVISIISLLSSVVLASVRDARQSAIDRKTVEELRQFMVALELYRIDHNTLPKPAGPNSYYWSSTYAPAGPPVIAQTSGLNLSSSLSGYIASLPVPTKNVPFISYRYDAPGDINAVTCSNVAQNTPKLIVQITAPNLKSFFGNTPPSSYAGTLNTYRCLPL